MNIPTANLAIPNTEKWTTMHINFEILMQNDTQTHAQVELPKTTMNYNEPPTNMNIPVANLNKL